MEKTDDIYSEAFPLILKADIWSGRQQSHVLRLLSCKNDRKGEDGGGCLLGQWDRKFFPIIKDDGKY